jgi:hypothetical protein
MKQSIYSIYAGSQVEISVNVGEGPQNANFVSYIEKCIHSFEQGSISTDMMVENLSAATVIQYMLMFLAGDVVRESARSINDYSTCLAIKKMMSFICFSFFRGTVPTCSLVTKDLYCTIRYT